jgi:NitT/TauT family transport system substrate-binding protein
VRVDTATLETPPDFGRALVGAWYETMALMVSEGEEGEPALATMAATGTDLEGCRARLAATAMFYDPAEAPRALPGSLWPRDGGD